MCGISRAEQPFQGRFSLLGLLPRVGTLGFDKQPFQGKDVIVNPPAATTTPVVSADPDDDPVLATASLGQAEVLCTRDHHLHSAAVKEYCSNHGIQILTDIEVLQILRAAASPPAP
jgi:predicted nucleic acid-binding protein